MTNLDISKILNELGLEHINVDYIGSLDTCVNVHLAEGPCSYDVLVKIATRFGTTDMSFMYVQGRNWSELTAEDSECTLRIRLPEGVAWSALMGTTS
jgi:hypothetical protein